VRYSLTAARPGLVAYATEGATSRLNRLAVALRGAALRELPDRFLRHRDLRLLVAPRDNANLAPDATSFRRQGSDNE
jgi:hypothetical protein